jgi:NTP pyrophosphatase (non-canonical NTP hydrolase)
MMNEHDQVPGTEYYWSINYGEPVGKEEEQMVDMIQELEDWEAEQLADMEEIDQYIFFDIYQDFTDSTAIYPPEKGLEYTALGLASEAGEFAGKVKKAIRDNTYDADAMAAELGDVLWYLARAAAELDYHLSTIAEMNVEKLKSRKERNVISGEGDNR